MPLNNITNTINNIITDLEDPFDVFDDSDFENINTPAPENSPSLNLNNNSSSSFLYQPLSQNNNIELNTINGPLLVSNVLGNVPISPIQISNPVQGMNVNYFYDDYNQISSMEQGYSIFLNNKKIKKSKSKNNNLISFSFKDKGKKIKKIKI